MSVMSIEDLILDQRSILFRSIPGTVRHEATRRVPVGASHQGPVLEPLKNPNCFRRFFLDGGAVSWPNSADVAPETLYERAEADQAA